MAIDLIDKIKPKNGGSFAMVDAQDVQVDDAGKRLPERLDELAQQAGNVESMTDADVDGMFLMADLVVSATAREGGQTVTVSTALGEGLQRRHMVTEATAAPVPAYDSTAPLSAGWVAFPEGGAVSGKAGQVVTVVDCTVSGAKVKAVGSAVLPAPLAAK